MRTIARDIRASLKDNSAAYGYSITITGSFTILTTVGDKPSVPSVFAAAAAAAITFALLEIAAVLLTRGNVSEDAQRTDRFLARMMNVISICGGMGGALVCSWLLSGIAAWITAASGATALFVLIESIELRLARLVEHSQQQELD